MESFISSELTEKTNFRIPGKVDFLSSTRTDAAPSSSKVDFPELCSPLLSCPFVLCVAAGQDVRVDTTQPGKGNTKVTIQRMLRGGRHNPGPASGSLTL